MPEAVDEAQFFEAVLRCVADGVFTVDCDWRITSFNRAAERVTGVPAERAIGRRCSEVLHSSLCEVSCPIRESLDTGNEVIDRSARILTQRARSIPISVSTAVLRAEDGTLLGAVETFRDLSTLEQLRREIQSQYTFEDIIGKSEAFQKIFALLPDIAVSESTVLIEGPSGSGKELLARAIHNLSQRRKRPYVVVNCGTLPANLFESELFGYKQGAFTDAKRDKPGRIPLAEGGTIFFDEIGDLPPETQVKLLRLLQEREYHPLGGVEPLQANVRIVAATNRDLSRLVSQGFFRDDLYFRLAVVRLSIPPLCERREDIPYLVTHFVERFNAKQGKRVQGVTPAVMEILMRHDLPGNVRELENILEYAFVLCHNGLIDVQHLPDDLQGRAAVVGASELREPREALPLEQSEADAIRLSLSRNRGHQGRTAQELQVSRTTLWRKMKKFGLRSADFTDVSTDVSNL
ncbi:MAG: sigma 54-interacting transcriptional regulator [Gemmatimonadetes bacterium]|nr:sigma 54-interacting transcriptional regulator [Gemmatimonadota bacterium]